MALEKQDFKLIVVVPKPDAGVIDPEDNEYYVVKRDDIEWDYTEVPTMPGTFTRNPREPLHKKDPHKDPHVAQWEEFVNRDVGIGHVNDEGITIKPFGTFLVNLAAFFNTK